MPPSAPSRFAALKLLRRMNRQRMSNFFGRLMRRVRPVAAGAQGRRENLTAAFPGKSPEEIERILAGVWENLGRVGAEFAHLDRMTVLDFERGGDADLMYDKTSFERFLVVRDAPSRHCVRRASRQLEVAATAPPTYNIKSNLLYPAAEHRGGQRCRDRNAGRLHGHPDPHRPGGAGAARERDRTRRACRHAGRPAFRQGRRRRVLFGRWPRPTR